MSRQDDVVTDGKIEVRGDWEEPGALLFWRPHEDRAPGRDAGEAEGWKPSIYTVGSFDHDHARALRVMSALWQFLHGASPRA